MFAQNGRVNFVTLFEDSISNIHPFHCLPRFFCYSFCNPFNPCENLSTEVVIGPFSKTISVSKYFKHISETNYCIPSFSLWNSHNGHVSL